jgi:hypothetical protein
LQIDLRVLCHPTKQRGHVLNRVRTNDKSPVSGFKHVLPGKVESLAHITLCGLKAPYRKPLDIPATARPAVPSEKLEIRTGTYLSLIAEMGVDMSVFGSLSQAASWVGVCPGNNESGGRRKSSRIRKGNVCLKTCFPTKFATTNWGTLTWASATNTNLCETWFNTWSVYATT